MKTVNRGEPAAPRASRRPTRTPRSLGLGASSLAIAAAISFVGLSALPARADEMSDMKAQIQSLQKQIDHLSSAERSSAGGMTKSGWVVPGTNTSVKFGGFVTFDLQADFGTSVGTTFSAASIGSDAGTNTQRSNNQLKLTGENTRLTMKTTTPTSEGPVQTFLQFDFRGGSNSGNPESKTNSYNPRLRHAYITWGPWLMGQTWSTFTSLGTAAPTIGWIGTAGGASVRQGLIRYTHPMGPVKLQLSIENPETQVLNIQTSGGTALHDHYPDVVGRILWLWHGMHLDFALLNRWLSVHQGTVNANAYGWGVTANAGIPVFGKDKIYIQSRYGKGIARYQDSHFYDGYIVGNDVKLSKSFGGRLGFKHVFTPNWYISVSGGVDATYKPNDVTDAQAGGSGKVQRFWSTAGDIFYRPFPHAVPGLWTGVEYAHGHNYKIDAVQGTDDRIDFATRFDF